MSKKPTCLSAPSHTHSAMPALPSRSPSIALALGGGGARGLAHIPILEAFDELGVKPKIMAGTSIGAIFAAAYASGMTGRQIRAHTQEVLRNRLDLVRDLYAARVRTTRRIWNVFPASSAFLAAERLLDIILPPRIARDFAHLAIPLKIVASDFYAQEPVVLDSGPLRQAIAASIALPVIFEPVLVDGRVLIDGGLVNPLPFDLLCGEADLTVAVDVSGAPVRRTDRERPNVWEALFAANFIFERTIIKEKLRSRQPDIYVDAGTSRYQVLDFLKLDEILAAAAPAKERFKAQLARVLEAETLPTLEAHEAPKELPSPSPSPRRLLLKRGRSGKA
jgi:NTE family protein